MIAYAVEQRSVEENGTTRNISTIGPAVEIHAGAVQPTVRVDPNFVAVPLPSRQAGHAHAQASGSFSEFLDSMAYEHMIEKPRSHLQPKLIVRLSGADDMATAEWLRRRVTFLHIPTNKVAALAAARRSNVEGGDWIRRIQRFSLEGAAGRTDLSEHCFHCQGTQLQLMRHGQDLMIEHTFADVSVGDIIGVIVHGRVRLVYDDGQSRKADGVDRGRRHSSLHLRFLIKELRPMASALIRAEETDIINNLLNSGRFRLGEDDLDEETEAGDHDGGEVNASNLSLNELLWPACEAKLDEVDRRLRSGRRGGLLDAMSRSDFDLFPHIAHALCTRMQLARKARERRRRPRPERLHSPICATLLDMFGGEENTMAWVLRHAGARQQCTIWSIFEFDPAFARWCANRGITIPPELTVDISLLKEVWELRNKPDVLQRAARIFASYGDEEERSRLVRGIDLIKNRPAVANVSLDDLLDIVRDIQVAEDRLRGEFDRMIDILQKCQQPVDDLDLSQI